MIEVKTTFRRTEEAGQTERAAHGRGWTVAKYVFLTGCGVFLYRVAAECALAERGYYAIGGEVFALFLPLFYYVFSTLIRDTIRDTKQIHDMFKEDKENAPTE